MFGRAKTSLLCMTTNCIAPIAWPRPLSKYFLYMCVSNATSLSADAAADSELEQGIIAQVRVLAGGEWVAFHPHSVLFISRSSFIYCCFLIEWHADYEKYDFPTHNEAELKRAGQRVAVSWQWGDLFYVLQIGQLWDRGSWTLKFHWGL